MTPASRRLIGVAPGPANGFTLDLIDCFERFGELIDWAMVILNPLEPWPGELCLGAAAAAGVEVITRVVDYGGLFFDDCPPGTGARATRPPRVSPRRLDRGRTRPVGSYAPDRRADWPDDDPTRVPVEPRPSIRECVVPTLIQEPARTRGRWRRSARS